MGVNLDADKVAVAPLEGKLNKQLVIRRCLIFLPLLPIVYLLYLISRYGVNVPYADEFTLAPFLLKAHDHTLTLADLFSQHNEHRYVFTRLIFIALNFCSQGNLRAEMFFSVFLAVLAGVNLWWLLGKTALLSGGARTFVLCLFSLLLFSPVQAENWTWGFQFPLFFCNFLLTAGLVVAFSELELRTKFAVCAGIAFIATFSFGGGVLLWGLTFPCALLAERETTAGTRWRWFAFWCALGVASIALYFFHYVKPPHHPPIAAAKKPMAYFRYITAFLGAHLSRATRLETIFQSVLIGTGLLTLYLAAIAYGLRRFRDRVLRNRLLPWFALGGYALLSATLAAAARIGFGVSQALDSRYTTFSLYISIAAIALFFIVKQDLRDRGILVSSAAAFIRAETILLTVFGISSLIAFAWGQEFMANSEKSRWRGKAALLFTNVIESGAIHDKYLVANAPDAKMFANQLDSVGLMHPRLLGSAEIRKLQTGTGTAPAGFLDAISVSGQSCTVVGWGVIPHTQGAAHCVVLSFDDPEKGPIVFRIAEDVVGRPDVAEALQSPAAADSGWACHFERSAVPPGDHLITAWAFDAERAILYRIDTPKVLH